MFRQFGEEATKQWFHADAMEAIIEVDFGADDNGNWDGTWTTTEDGFALDILEEDMGIKFDCTQMVHDRDPVLLTVDDASVYTFGSEMELTTPSTRQTGSVTLAEEAAATSSSGGATV